MNGRLSSAEKTLLLKCAREAILEKLGCGSNPLIDISKTPERLREPGATFVTLTKNGELCGCVGALDAKLPLIQDVQEHAVAAAFHDYRFPPLTVSELQDTKIEISLLTCPVHIQYEDPDDLLSQIHPHVDGITLRDGYHRATFLPQVWKKIPSPEKFISSLCQKMGAAPDLWLVKKLEVYTYQVEKFHE
jgi:AmmeMemoRadiSam system protein A